MHRAHYQQRDLINMESKPYKLFLYADEQAFNTLACYVTDWIEMPNLNPLASVLL